MMARIALYCRSLLPRSRAGNGHGLRRPYAPGDQCDGAVTETPWSLAGPLRTWVAGAEPGFIQLQARSAMLEMLHRRQSTVEIELSRDQIRHDLACLPV